MHFYEEPIAEIILVNDADIIKTSDSDVQTPFIPEEP